MVLFHYLLYYSVFIFNNLINFGVTLSSSIALIILFLLIEFYALLKSIKNSIAWILYSYSAYLYRYCIIMWIYMDSGYTWYSYIQYSGNTIYTYNVYTWILYSYRIYIKFIQVVRLSSWRYMVCGSFLFLNPSWYPPNCVSTTSSNL